MFKRDVRKYSSFHEHIKKLDVLAKVEEYLSNMENINDLTVYQHDNTILITKNTDDYVEQDILQIDKNCIIDDQMVIEEVPLKCNLEEEYIEEIHEDQIDDIEVSSSIKVKSDGFEEIHSDYSFKDERSESYQSSSESPQAKIRKKYVYKVNTNDSLTGEQMSWLKQQVSKSQIIVNGKKLFKCQLCGTVLQIPGSLKKHLRDSHLLKSKEEENERAFRRAFKQEISNSKIEVNPKEGLEFIWKCQRCTDDRIFRSESGLKVHLRYTHIRSQVIDADFVAGCKISIENGKQIKNAWQCPECSKILRSRDGLRNHLKVEHPLLVDKLQTSTDLKDDLEKNVNLEKSQSTSWMSEKLSKVHPRSTHKNENRYVCSPCGLQFVNGSTKRDKSLEIHQQLHIILKTVSQSYELPKCEQCKVMFSNNEDLANHLINHDPDDVFVAEGLSLLVAVKYSEPIGTASNDDFDNWKCGHCAHARFKEEIECIEHQMILHSKQMICPIDYLEFNGIRGLSQFSIHMKNKHLEMFPDLTIACSYCHHEFPNIFDKLTHMKSCDRKEFACDHCPKKFFNKTQLLRHLKIVSGVISFSCDVCQKVSIVKTKCCK